MSGIEKGVKGDQVKKNRLTPYQFFLAHIGGKIRVCLIDQTNLNKREVLS
jgi:hypothetical protein